MPTITSSWYGIQSGAAPAASLLLDQFPGATVLLSLSKENSAYGGNCVQISSSTGTSQVNIGFTGNSINMTALNSALAGGTRFVDTWYDQSGNGNNATQSTLSKRYQIIVDTDGNPSVVKNGVKDATCGMVIADNASHKTAVIDAYMVGRLGYHNFDGQDDPHCYIGWMDTTASAFQTQARWAWGESDIDGFELPRNATAFTQRKSTSYPTTLPLTGSRSLEWMCHHYNSNRLAYRSNDVLLWDDVTENGTATANVTYTGTGALYVGMQGNGNANTNSSWRTIVLFGTTRADHASIASYLTTRWTVNTVFPSSYDSGDGFLWTPKYFTSYELDPTADANGLRYWYESGSFRDDGIRGPSLALASNVNNGVTLMRSAVNAFDSDMMVTGAERSERGVRLTSSNTDDIAKGDTFERFWQFYIEPGPSQTGSWAMIGQIHYAGGNSPDIMFLSVQNNQLEVFTQRNGGADVSRSTATSFSRGTWYAIRVRGVWSAGGTADVLQVWLGLNGTTLTQVTNAGPAAIFSTDTSSAYPKQGIYRGYGNYDDPNNANSGLLAVRFANEMFSKTSGAYASFVTTQPNLPTHA